MNILVAWYQSVSLKENTIYQQGLVHACGVYSTLKATHNLVACRIFPQLGCHNLSQNCVSYYNVVIIISSLFQPTFLVEYAILVYIYFLPQIEVFSVPALDRGFNYTQKKLVPRVGFLHYPWVSHRFTEFPTICALFCL